MNKCKDCAFYDQVRDEDYGKCTMLRKILGLQNDDIKSKAYIIVSEDFGCNFWWDGVDEDEQV